MEFGEGSPAGIYEGVPACEYHKTKHTSHSKVKPLVRHETPEHYKHALDNPITPTTDMMMGTATHTLILEPHLFDETVETGPTATRRSKSWKERQAEVPDKILLTEGETHAVEGMAARIHEEPELVALMTMAGNVFEPTVRWDYTADSGTVIECKSRPDLWLRSPEVLLDLKTTDSVDDYTFGKRMLDLCYFSQGAMYQHAMGELGYKIRDVLILAIERKPPYVLDLIRIDTETLDLGWRRVRAALEIVATCRERNSYPGNTIDLSNIRTVSVPYWAL